VIRFGQSRSFWFQDFFKGYIYYAKLMVNVIRQVAGLVSVKVSAVPGLLVLLCVEGD